MKIIRATDYKDMSPQSSQHHLGPGHHEAQLRAGLATGSTPIGIYEQLIDWYNKGDPGFFRSDQRQPGRVPRPAP